MRIILKINKNVMKDIPHIKQTSTRTAQKHLRSQHIHTRSHTHMNTSTNIVLQYIKTHMATLH